MANTKISALPSGILPLSRTEPLPFVQASTTKQITVEDLTGEYELVGTLVSADALTCGTIPVIAIPSPGVGYYIRILRPDIGCDFNTTPYNAGKVLVLKTGTATKPQFGFVSAFIATGSQMTMGAQQNLTLAGAAAGDIQLVENEGVYFTTLDGVNEANGDSDFPFRIRYEIVAKLL